MGMTKEQMREYQKARRKKLKDQPAVSEVVVASKSGTMDGLLLRVADLEKRVMTLESKGYSTASPLVFPVEQPVVKTDAPPKTKQQVEKLLSALPGFQSNRFELCKTHKVFKNTCGC
jgi:hypothetical protein